MTKVPNYHQTRFRSKFEVIKRDGAFKSWKKARLTKQLGLCFYCHKPIGLRYSHTDHLVPLNRGGKNNRQNLVVTCAKCNLDKGTKVLSCETILNKRIALNKIARTTLENIKQQDDDFTDMLRSF